LPAGLTPVPANGTFTNNGWSCNVVGQIVTCTRADALAPATAYPALALTVQVLASAPPTVSNTANVSGGGDVVSTNNNATDVASVALPGTFFPPLGIKRGVASGNVVTWTVVWINNANAVANRVRITDLMPSGSVFVAGSLICTPTGSTTVQSCSYNPTLQRIEVDATIAADASTATTEQAANNELVITLSTALVNINSTSLTNQALANWDANGNGSVSDELAANQQPVVTDDPTTSAGGDPTSVTVTLPAVIQTPTLGPLALLMLIFLLAIGGLYGRKRLNL
jgi:uncharacterized repeat protein (TIGR01451 family)